MKKTLIQCCLGCLALVTMCSCEKDTFENYNASYSYKLSGNVTLVPTLYAEASTEALDSMIAAGDVIDTLQCPVKPEQGQLRIVDKGDGSTYLTFNNMTGGVTLANAQIDKKHFTFSGTDKEISILYSKHANSNNNNIEDIISEPNHHFTTYVAYEGTGDEFNKTLIFTLRYTGKVKTKDFLKEKEWTIIDSNIECVANQNE